MTWVIGACPPFGGYAVALSDVQVTLPDGSCVDALQKVYPVGPCLVLGFSGSVRIGFQMVDSLRKFLAIPAEAPPGSAWIPGWVADNWYSEAARIFADASAGERKLRSSLLLVGVHPTEDVIPTRARPFVIRMSDPSFRPGYSPKKLVSVLSIGAGSRVPAYRRAVREVFSPRSGIMQAEVGTVGGWGRAISHAVGYAIGWHPQAGISAHMLYSEITREGIRIQNNDRIEYPKDGPAVEFRMPPIACTYAELVDLLGAQGHRAIDARC